MKITVLSIFPRLFDQVFDAGMIRLARERELADISVVDLREFTADPHRTTDDRPFGGGEGMVLKPEPVFRAVEACAARFGRAPHVVLLSPQGSRFDQDKAKELALKEHLVLICGRYEGVDQRVADHLADEEISIGDFVVSGGEFAALLIVDAVSRLLPGVVGNASSVLEESFMNGMLDFPHYTRPADFRGWKVPKVLLSGDHALIKRWREKKALERTRMLRPDLLAENPRENASEKRFEG